MSPDISRVQFFNGEHQIPIATPNNIAVVNGERTEFFGIKILVVLRMGMSSDEVTNIHNTVAPVAEKKSQL